jgi:hypothetical protein
VIGEGTLCSLEKAVEEIGRPGNLAVVENQGLCPGAQEVDIIDVETSVAHHRFLWGPKTTMQNRTYQFLNPARSLSRSYQAMRILHEN